MHHINAAYEKVHSNQLCHPLRSASLVVNQAQVNIRWMTMPATPDGILETLTVVVTVWMFNNLVPRALFVLALVRGWMFNKTLCLSKSRIEVYWSLFLLRVHKFSRPEYRREQFVR
jgi:hypothetical protein